MTLARACDTITDHLTGETWTTLTRAATGCGLRPGTVHAWVRAGKVRARVVAGQTWVALDDVTDAELEWEQRTRQRAGGHPRHRPAC